MANSTFVYCSSDDVKKVYSRIDEHDSKIQIFNWDLVFTHSGFNLYESKNTGSVTQLFMNGQNLGGSNVTVSYTDSTTNTNEALDATEEVITMVSGSVFSRGDYIKIENEVMLVTVISTNDITVRRGWAGTTAVSHSTDTDVYIGTSFDYENDWYYDSDLDVTLLYVSSSTDPNDNIVESGYDWDTYLTNQIEASSMQLNSMLDHSRFPIPIPQSVVYDDTVNQAGTPEYDYVIIRLTALLTAYNCIVAREPLSEEAEAIMGQISNENGMGLLDRLNEGTLTLNFETDRGDSTQGKILQIVKAGSMRLVEATCPEGFYGEPYERVQILCTASGGYGDAKASIKVTGDSKLYGSTISTDFEISGGLQHIASGLYCRFEGATMNVGDRFDVEVRNRTLKTTDGRLKSVDIFRGKRWTNEM